MSQTETNMVQMRLDAALRALWEIYNLAYVTGLRLDTWLPKSEEAKGMAAALVYLEQVSDRAREALLANAVSRGIVRTEHLSDLRKMGPAALNSWLCAPGDRERRDVCDETPGDDALEEEGYGEEP